MEEPPAQPAANSPQGGFLATMKTPRPAQAAAASRALLSARQGASGEGAGPTGVGAQSNGGADNDKREPVLLILDSSLQAVPWESVPGLCDQRCALGSSSLRALSCAVREACCLRRGSRAQLST